MAVRLARSLAASRPSRGNRCSASVITSSAINGGEFSDFHRAFAFYSSSSSWWSSPEDLTAGSKRREKNTTDRLSAVIDAVHDRKLPPELRGRRDFVRYSLFPCFCAHLLVCVWTLESIDHIVRDLGFIRFVENQISGHFSYLNLAFSSSHVNFKVQAQFKFTVSLVMR